MFGFIHMSKDAAHQLSQPRMLACELLVAAMAEVPRIVLRARTAEGIHPARAFLMTGEATSEPTTRPLIRFFDCGPIPNNPNDPIQCGPLMSLSPTGHHVAFQDIRREERLHFEHQSIRVIDLAGKSLLLHQPPATCSTASMKASSSEEERPHILSPRPHIVGIDWLTADEVVFAAICYGRVPHAITMHSVSLKPPHDERLLHTLKLPFAASALQGGLHIALPRHVASNRSRVAIRISDPSARYAASAYDDERVALDRVYTMRIDGSELQNVSQTPSTQVVYGETVPTVQRGPAISRDGRTVAWCQATGSRQYVLNHQIVAHDRNRSEDERRHGREGMAALYRTWTIETLDLATPDAQPVSHGPGDDPFFASDGRLGFMRFKDIKDDGRIHTQFVIVTPHTWTELAVFPPGVSMMGRASLQ